MKHLVLITTVLLAPLAAPGADWRSGDVGVSAGFARLKSLVGDWQGDTPMGKAGLRYELVAAGTAILDRENIENMPPMLTVYYLDGDRLLLTHYCMTGNQPRMQARAYDAANRELKFQFLDATNLTSPAAGHMRNATFRFVDDQHLKTAWEFYEDGRLKMNESAEYTRVR